MRTWHETSCSAGVTTSSRCHMTSTPSRNSRSPNTAAAPRPRHWSPNGASRSPPPPPGWTRHSAPTTASGELTVAVCAEYDALPGHRTCVRAQHHCRVRGRGRAGARGGGRRPRADGRADGDARRRVRWRKSVAAQGRSVRRHLRGGDGAPRSGRHRRGPVAGAVRGERPLPRPRVARIGGAASRCQRRRRRDRRASGDRSAASAPCARATGARHRHRGRPGAERHPGTRGDAVLDAGHRQGVAEKPRKAGFRLLPRRRAGHRR